MSSNITKGLAEAYNSIYSQENSLYEEVENFIYYLDEIGYDVSVLGEDNIAELFIICNSDINVLNEGVESLPLKFSKFSRALENARKGISVQRKFITTPRTINKSEPNLLQHLASGWKNLTQRMQNYNQNKPSIQSFGKDLADVTQKVRTGVGDVRTLATAAKNVVLGKTGRGLVTRLAGAGAVDQAFSGAPSEWLARKVGDVLSTTRAAGERAKQEMRKEPPKVDNAAQNAAAQNAAEIERIQRKFPTKQP